jgi:hypothetical protein
MVKIKVVNVSYVIFITEKSNVSVKTIHLFCLVTESMVHSPSFFQPHLLQSAIHEIF